MKYKICMHCIEIDKCKSIKSKDFSPYMATCKYFIEIKTEKERIFGYPATSDKAKCSLCKCKIKNKLFFGMVLREGKHIISYDPPRTFLLTYICTDCLRLNIEFR